MHARYLIHTRTINTIAVTHSLHTINTVAVNSQFAVNSCLTSVYCLTTSPPPVSLSISLDAVGLP